MNREQLKESVRQQVSCKQFLKRSKSGMYNCPFCGSGTGKHSTGALKLYDTNTWTCHACGKSGDIIDLYQQEKGVDYNTALQDLAEIANIAIDGSYNPNVAKVEQKDSKKQYLDFTDYYEKCKESLHNSKDAISYLAARGISQETANKYNLGYDAAADPAGNGFRTARIIVPVNAGHYIARRIDGEAACKAMNNKGCTMGIFNADILNKETDKEKHIFIVEGWADAISIEECGANAIALNSINNTGMFLELISKNSNTRGYIICLDNDGNPNTAKAVGKLKEGLASLNLPYIEADITAGYKDANEAFTGSREALKAGIDAAVKAIEAETKRKRSGNEAANSDSDPQQQDYLESFFTKIQTEAYKPYSTGLGFFDNMLNGGVMRQTLLLLMAAPGTGKTTLCQQIAEEMAARKKPVIYLNFEMSREQMLAKALSYKLASSKKGHKMSATDILQGYKWRDNEAEKQIIDGVLAEYRENSYPYIKYNPGNIGSDIDEIMKYLREVGNMAKFNGEQVPVVVVDYLHLISSKRGLDVQELIKQTVTELKRFAIEYDTFVIGIVATNRSSNGAISLDSGRDSSNLEYSGDYVLSLDYYEVDKQQKRLSAEEMAKEQKKKYRHMILRVLKGRLGEVGNYARVYYNASNNIFYGEHDFIPVDDELIPFDTDLHTNISAGARKRR